MPAEEKPTGDSPVFMHRLHRLHRLTDPRILFPVITILLLSIIWLATFNLIRAEYESARQIAASSTADLTDTYEAQVLRALREVDQVMKFIQYVYEFKGEETVLSEMDSRDLLPPAFLFVVRITNDAGYIIASTRGSADRNVADHEYFQVQHQTDTLFISPSQLDPASGEWSVHLSRRLNTGDGTFAGIVMVTVDAGYFVSGYEQTALGQRGMLAILGTDGLFRARRTGDALSYGDSVDYTSVVSPGDQLETTVKLSVNEWDGVNRYTAARELYAFPLAVVVGLSEEEQLAGADELRNYRLLLASGASLLAILVLMALGRLSWQLQQSRQRETAAQLAHAQRVEYLAYHDGLTGLPNRSHFSKLLNQGINQACRYNRRLSLLFLDLDRFKLINDTLGHDAGDDLLIEVARRLKSSLRDSDTVARMGGDEFVVLLPEMNEEKDITAVAMKVLSAVGKPFTLARQELRITVSIGISNYPDDGEDEQTLIKNADVAMYNAKEQGKNNFQFYSAELNANSLERLSLESNLRQALERNEFRLYYQAKTNLHKNRITGMEALLRWQHPDLGLILPRRFIPLAEETGLIIPIGKWVLETACRQSVAWREQGLPPLSMAVNISAHQFSDDNLLQDITAVIQQTGMDPHRLELEVTESMLIRDLEKTVQILHKLKDTGVRIAIDDFGTGYSSLATLKQFHLDTIKIDGSFIRDISSNDEDKGLTEAIITMGRVLGLTVVAEGVETREQANFLEAKLCDEMQGVYFSEPMAADGATGLLQSHNTDSAIELNSSREKPK